MKWGIREAVKTLCFDLAEQIRRTADLRLPRSLPLLNDCCYEAPSPLIGEVDVCKKNFLVHVVLFPVPRPPAPVMLFYYKAKPPHSEAIRLATRTVLQLLLLCFC